MFRAQERLSVVGEDAKTAQKLDELDQAWQPITEAPRQAKARVYEKLPE